MANETELRALLAKALPVFEDAADTLRKLDRPHTAADVQTCIDRITAELSEKEDGGWLPIETAPKDNKRMLYLARIVDGELRELDFDGIWQSESESWEMPEVYYYWASANGIEEPTHWTYQDQPLPPLPERKEGVR